ncbi:MAG: NAD-dependent epimerase/dehydratase family protein, partial [Actinocrinis sp.]
FAPPGGKRFDAVWKALASTEQQVLNAPGIEGVVLRYGGFYGPSSIGPMLDVLRKRQAPVPRGGGSFASLVYVDDAAAATVLAIDRAKADEVYNIVDDEPVQWGVFIAAVTEAFGLPKPFTLPGAVLRLAAPYTGTMMTRQSLRLSNAKAKEQLGWRPSVPTYRQGVAALAAALARPEDVDDAPEPGRGGLRARKESAA